MAKNVKNKIITLSLRLNMNKSSFLKNIEVYLDNTSAIENRLLILYQDHLIIKLYQSNDA